MKNLFRHWEHIRKKIKSRHLLLFLDYDGTLAPVVSRPAQARLSRSTKRVLEQLSRRPQCELAIISGRALQDIKQKVRLKNIIYSGNHGFELEGPHLRFRCPLKPGYAAVVREIKNVLKNKTVSLRGVWIEDKGLTLAVHYRGLSPEKRPLLKTIFHKAAFRPWKEGVLHKRSGKMLLEVRPSVQWNKGKIVLWLLARKKNISGKKAVFPIYIGDDITDEDAFKVLRTRGITVRVGKRRHSLAQYYVKNPQEVGEFLRRIECRLL